MKEHIAYVFDILIVFAGSYFLCNIWNWSDESFFGLCAVSMAGLANFKCIQILSKIKKPGSSD